MVRLRLYSIELLLVLILGAAVTYFGFLGYGLLAPAFVVEPFSGDRALNYVQKQVDFGDRTTGSDSSIQMSQWLIDELRLLGWDVVVQPFNGPDNKTARNIIAIRSPSPASTRTALLLTHYDTRLFADRDEDPNNQKLATPGANDGGSGTAVLLELARTLNVNATGHTVCLVFLDAESNADIPGWEAGLGSNKFVQDLNSIERCRSPRFGVYLGMVGGQNQRLNSETTSFLPLTKSVWDAAAELGFGNTFIADSTWSTNDDAHARFREIDVPAITISDSTYRYRATMQDTFQQLSSQSLAQVGNTLKTWLERGAPFPEK